MLSINIYYITIYIKINCIQSCQNFLLYKFNVMCINNEDHNKINVPMLTFIVKLYFAELLVNPICIY